MRSGIQAIEPTSIRRITSGQVVIDLQTAVKELVENSLDAGATVLEVRFKNYGLTSIEVVDNGTGIEEADWDAIALNHHTSKLTTLDDLDTVQTFGFRGEALSSLCALCESVSVSTTTKPPMGVILELEASGKVKSKGKVARQRGTTIVLSKLFAPLPVRRKELERHVKREFGKAVALLQAYALGPCAQNGVRMTVSNQPDKGQKSVQLRTPGTPSLRAAATALWGPRALDNVVDLDISFLVERDKHSLKRLSTQPQTPIRASLRGLISAFAPGSGRAGADRQFFYVNGRPCLLPKIQKTLTEVYRTFNAPGTQAPMVVADLILPTNAYDVNVSPDKRTIFVHHEAGLMQGLKVSLEEAFAPVRSTFGVSPTQTQTQTGSKARAGGSRDEGSKAANSRDRPIVLEDGDNDEEENVGGEEEGKDVGMEQLETSSITQTKDVTINGRKATTNNTVSSDSPFLQPVSTTSTSIRAATVLSTAKATVKVSSLSKSTSTIQTKLAFSKSTNKADPTSSTSVSTSRIVAIAPKRRESSVSNDLEEDDDVANEDHDVPANVTDDDDESESVRTLDIDASQTTWGRKLGIGITSGSSGTLKRTEIPESASGDARDDGDEQGRPQKRRRSEGVGSMEDEGDNVNPEMHLDLGGKTQTPPAAGLNCSQPKALMQTQRQSKQNLRAMLAEFAGPGAGIQTSQQRRDQSDAEEDELDSSGEGDETQMDVDKDEDIGAAAPDESEVIDTRPIIDTADLDSHSDKDAFDTSELSFSHPSMDPNSNANTPVVRREVIRTLDDGQIVLRIEVESIAGNWAKLRDELQSATESDLGSGVNAGEQQEVLKAAGLVAPSMPDVDVAAQALSRTISKSDFASMDIVGQFNLGFIVVRRRVAAASITESDSGMAMDDLFIVDQHAADEKYNFETLQQTTSIKSQKLFRPQPLELTASDELLALEKIEVLRQNGFEVEVQTEAGVIGVEDDEILEMPATTPRLALTAQPVSKGTVFDMKDLEELIHRMRDAPAGTIPRCTKARAMFASRACRKSVMIGMPLTKGQMTAVVRHMGTMDQPWNCPHGRPTMRHLADILPERRSRTKREVDWGTFA